AIPHIGRLFSGDLRSLDCLDGRARRYASVPHPATGCLAGCADGLRPASGAARQDRCSRRAAGRWATDEGVWLLPSASEEAARCRRGPGVARVLVANASNYERKIDVLNRTVGLVS